MEGKMKRFVLVVLWVIYTGYSIADLSPNFEWESPIYLLGQSSFNSGGPVPYTLPPPNATNFRFPGSLYVSSNSIYVADSTYNRILIFSNPPTSLGSPAVQVLFADNFKSQGPQYITGVHGLVNGSILVTGYGKYVYRFDPPFQNGQMPNAEFSGPGFLTAFSVEVDQNLGDLYVVDTEGNRVLKYLGSNLLNSDLSKPDMIYGQPDAQTTTGAQAPSATTLLYPRYAKLDCAGGLWVSDEQNYRVVHYPAGSKVADIVLGQADLTSRIPPSSYNAQRVRTPAGIALNSDCSKLWISQGDLLQQSGRIMQFSAPFRNNQSSDGCLGATSPELAGVKDNSNSSVRVPGELSFERSTGMLWIADNYNSRIIAGKVSEPASPSPKLPPGYSMLPSSTSYPGSGSNGNGNGGAVNGTGSASTLFSWLSILSV